MSLQNRFARDRYFNDFPFQPDMRPMILRHRRRDLGMGDPGFFDFIGKAVGGLVKVGVGAAKGFLTGGPIGAIGGGLSSAGIIRQPAMMNLRGGLPPLQTAGVMRLPGGPGGNRLQPGVGFQAGPGGVGIGYFGPDRTGAGGAVGMAAGSACPVGHHLAKDGSGKCVTNRRMNPLNPRALSRALRRLSSAKNAAKMIGRFSIRSGCGCGPRRARAPRAKRGR